MAKKKTPKAKAKAKPVSRASLLKALEQYRDGYVDEEQRRIIADGSVSALRQLLESLLSRGCLTCRACRAQITVALETHTRAEDHV